MSSSKLVILAAFVALHLSSSPSTSAFVGATLATNNTNCSLWSNGTWQVVTVGRGASVAMDNCRLYGVSILFLCDRGAAVRMTNWTFNGPMLEIAGPTGNASGYSAATSYLQDVMIDVIGSTFNCDTGVCLGTVARPNNNGAIVVENVVFRVKRTAVTNVLGLSSSPAVALGFITTGTVNTVSFRAVVVNVLQRSTIVASSASQTAVAAGMLVQPVAVLTHYGGVISVLCSSVSASAARATAETTAVAAGVLVSNAGSTTIMTVANLKIGVMNSGVSASATLSTLNAASAAALVVYTPSDYSPTGVLLTLADIALYFRGSTVTAAAGGAPSASFASAGGLLTLTITVVSRLSVRSFKSTIDSSSSANSASNALVIAAASSAAAVGMSNLFNATDEFYITSTNSTISATTAADAPGASTAGAAIKAKSSAASLGIATSDGAMMVDRGTIRSNTSTVTTNSGAHSTGNAANANLACTGGSSVGVSSGSGAIASGNVTLILVNSSAVARCDATTGPGHAAPSDSSAAVGIIAGGGGVTRLGVAFIFSAFSTNVSCATGVTNPGVCATANTVQVVTPLDEPLLATGVVPHTNVATDDPVFFSDGLRTDATFCSTLPTFTLPITLTGTLPPSVSHTFSAQRTGSESLTTTRGTTAPTWSASRPESESRTVSPSVTETVTVSPTRATDSGNVTWTQSYNLSRSISTSRSRSLTRSKSLGTLSRSLSVNSTDTWSLLLSSTNTLTDPTPTGTDNTTVSKSKGTLSTTGTGTKSGVTPSRTRTSTKHSPSMSNTPSHLVSRSLSTTRTPSATWTPSESIELHAPPTFPPAFVDRQSASYVEAVAMTAASVGAAFISPGAALQASRAMAVLWMSFCFQDYDAPLPFPMSVWPTFRIWPERQGSYYRGAVVAAVATLGGIAAVASVVALVHSRWGRYHLNVSLSRLRFPSIMVVFLGLTIDSLVSCAVAAGFHGDARPADFPLIGLVVVVAVGYATVSWRIGTVSSVACSTYVKRVPDSRIAPRDVTCATKVDRYLRSLWHWVPKDDRPPKDGDDTDNTLPVAMVEPTSTSFFEDHFTRHKALGIVYEKYRLPTKHYYTIEVVSTVLISVLKGVSPITLLGCKITMVLAAVVCIAIAILAVYTMPYSAPAKNHLLLGVTAFTALGAVVTAVGMFVDVGEVIGVGQVAASLGAYLCVAHIGIALIGDHLHRQDMRRAKDHRRFNTMMDFDGRTDELDMGLLTNTVAPRDSEMQQFNANDGGDTLRPDSTTTRLRSVTREEVDLMLFDADGVPLSAARRRARAQQQVVLDSLKPTNDSLALLGIL